jgi:hypothetical protein
MFPLFNFNKKQKNKILIGARNNKKISKSRAIAIGINEIAYIRTTINDVQVSMTALWADISGTDSTWDFYDNLKKIGLQYTTTINGIENSYRDDKSYYELVLTDYSILPQNNASRYATMVGNYNSAKDLLLVLNGTLDTWNANRKILETKKDDLDEIFAILNRTSVDDFEKKNTVKSDYVGESSFQSQVASSWTDITAKLKVIDGWFANVRSGISNMEEWIRIVRINVSNALAEEGTSLGNVGNLNATWLVNDSTVDAEKFLKQWDKQNLISENKLFNFSKKRSLNNSSDQIKKIKQLQQIKSLNTRTKNVEKNFSMNSSGVVYKYLNHSSMLSMKFAYQNTNGKQNCYNKRNNATNLKESVLTETDLSDNYLLDSGGGGTQNYFQINNKINYSSLMRKQFDAPKYKALNKIKVIKQAQVSDLCCNLLQGDIIQPEPHVLDHPNEIHQHYFPINNNKYGLYIHNHGDNPHTKRTIPPHSFQFFTHRFSKNPKME